MASLQRVRRPRKSRRLRTVRARAVRKDGLVRTQEIISRDGGAQPGRRHKFRDVEIRPVRCAVPRERSWDLESCGLGE